METVAVGPITRDELEMHWRAELTDGGEPYPELIDASAATVAFDSTDVRRVIELVKSTAIAGQLGPTAVVVQSDVGYGMVRMFSLLVEPFCLIRPFRDREAAEAWLRSAESSGDEAASPPPSA
jgi:hypothetical protein